ncbi:MAG TPA: hypothetical protein VN639_11105 [Azonexus sp.]|nr:hypothetical protein [Azonexus sp.]
MKRRNLLKGIAALALAEHLGMLRAAWAAGGKLPPPGFYRISGEVTINGQPAQTGMPVRPGDTVATGPNSEAIYIVGNDVFLQRDRTVVNIVGDAVKSGLRLLTGKLLAVFGKGDKRILTPTATIGIRGTGCYLEASPDQVYFCLCYGTADVASLKDPTRVETIVSWHHDHPVYLPADSAQITLPAKLKNHTDEELVLLESLVGRVPSFYGPAPYGSKY